MHTNNTLLNLMKHKKIYFAFVVRWNFFSHMMMYLFPTFCSDCTRNRNRLLWNRKKVHISLIYYRMQFCCRCCWQFTFFNFYSETNIYIYKCDVFCIVVVIAVPFRCISAYVLLLACSLNMHAHIYIHEGEICIWT